MDKLRNLNVAGKITSGFKNFNSQKMTAFFTYLVIVLVVIVVLFGVYLYLLEKGDLDIVFHEKGVKLSSNVYKNIHSKYLPTVSSSAYTLNAWFAVDKSQYINKKNAPYSHLISYGRTRINRKNEKTDPFAMGVYIDTSDNNLNTQQISREVHLDGFVCAAPDEIIRPTNCVDYFIDKKTEKEKVDRKWQSNFKNSMRRCS